MIAAFVEKQSKLRSALLRYEDDDIGKLETFAGALEEDSVDIVHVEK
jgi:hypothetical protein